ncbi:hypothetical protein PENNAL_c0190G04329 [Penicillium nalgiovense]|uniref:Zn(2)-C6 fungal-type domain-containing protein n=1 Tax=Penicillium nalgiovense TaxID=60175 RepID=A0A1V6WTY2_PENNA|nr:hypothetical protein HAV15_012217 [Penicillium sp. str. \
MAASHFRTIRSHAPIMTASEVDGSQIDVSRRDSKKRLSIACKECQRRRTKCSVGNPCLECTKRGSACIFDESSDKRRKSHFRRMEEELRHYQGFLDEFLKNIRNSSEADLQHIIHVVRSGSSIDEIQNAMTNLNTENYQLERTT